MVPIHLPLALALPLAVPTSAHAGSATVPPSPDSVLATLALVPAGAKCSPEAARRRIFDRGAAGPTLADLIDARATRLEALHGSRVECVEVTYEPWTSGIAAVEYVVVEMAPSGERWLRYSIDLGGEDGRTWLRSIGEDPEAFRALDGAEALERIDWEAARTLAERGPLTLFVTDGSACLALLRDDVGNELRAPYYVEPAANRLAPLASVLNLPEGSDSPAPTGVLAPARIVVDASEPGTVHWLWVRDVGEGHHLTHLRTDTARLGLPRRDRSARVPYGELAEVLSAFRMDPDASWESLDGFVEVEVVESVAFRGVEMPARSTTIRGPSGARSWSRVRYAEAPEFLETEAAERFRIDAVPPEFESMPFRWLGDFRCGNE